MGRVVPQHHRTTVRVHTLRPGIPGHGTDARRRRGRGDRRCSKTCCRMPRPPTIPPCARMRSSRTASLTVHRTPPAPTTRIAEALTIAQDKRQSTDRVAHRGRPWRSLRRNTASPRTPSTTSTWPSATYYDAGSFFHLGDPVGNPRRRSTGSDTTKPPPPSAVSPTTPFTRASVPEIDVPIIAICAKCSATRYYESLARTGATMTTAEMVDLRTRADRACARCSRRVAQTRTRGR